MKKNWLFRRLPLLALLCLLLSLSACGSSQAPQDTPDQSPAEETPEAPAETLEALCGTDYQTYLVDTITMQMENRMEKTPDVAYFPVQDNKPLTDYVAIDETTAFAVNEKGNLVITFPAGSVTDEANGEQSFIVPLPGETQAPEAETLEDFCGADYQTFLTDTITMQMENRMEKTPDVVYFPIRDSKPLTDYVAIDETTAFRVEEGYLVILLPAGSVTDEANGEQSFRVLSVIEK